MNVAQIGVVVLEVMRRGQIQDAFQGQPGQDLLLGWMVDVRERGRGPDDFWVSALRNQKNGITILGVREDPGEANLGKK